MQSLVFSNMLHRPERTLVSIAGIGIGILLILFTVGLSNGSLRERAKREANVQAEIFFRPAGMKGISGSEALSLPVSLKPEVEKIEGVKTVVAFGQTTMAAGDTNFGGRLVDGITYDDFAAIANLQLTGGRVFTPGSDEVMADTAWLPQNKYKIGDKMKIYERDFTIVGTYEPAVSGRIKIPLATMQNQLGAEGRASSFLVKIKDGFTVEQVAESIQAKFPDYQIIRASELEELYMSSVPALNVFLNVVIGVAGFVSALIVLLTMYTTVTERTRQIGIMKALGMSKLGIASVILQESLLITVGGIICGILLSILLKFAMDNWTTLHVEIESKTILWIIVVGIISGAIGALYPSYQAARLDAVDALNYD